MSDNAAKRPKLDDSGEQEIEGIHGVGYYIGANSLFTKLSSAPISIKESDYEWKVSFDRKIDGDLKTFVVSAELTSRYVFDDKHEMEVFLKTKETFLTSKVFSLVKSDEKQEFQMQYDKTWSVLFDEVDVFVYLSDWATEYNFKNKNRPHDVILVVGDKEFYMFKNYLATWSKYFDRLFYGNFKEKNQERIEIDEVDPVNFELILAHISPQLNWELDNNHVLEILKLADRFDISNLIGRCDKLLCDFENLKDLELLDRLKLADKYNLVSLQIACFERIHSLNNIARAAFFEENRGRIQNLSNNVRKNLFEHI